MFNAPVSSASPLAPSPLGPGALKTRWRTVDIVIVALIGAVFGVIYWAWGYFPASSVFAFFAPAAAFTNTVFLMAGPLAMLIVRRPGAALAGELLAALFEAMVSVQWSGSSIIVYGLIQGAGAEAVFLVMRYRNWSWPAALLSGACSGVAMAALDLWIYRYYPTYSGGWQLGYVIAALVGGVVIAGGLSWLLVRALAVTGVLAPFASGRQQKLV
jgi:energy-coupling factor transport system substrate-specific component